MMEELRRWALLLCCGCILYGLLENLLPRRGTFPVIKAVAVLYIVSILLSPAQSLTALRSVKADFTRQGGSVQSLPEDAVLRQAESVLFGSLSDALRMQVPDAELISLRLESTDGQLDAVHLHLRTPEAAEREQIRRICDTLLGMEGRYEWEDG